MHDNDLVLVLAGWLIVNVILDLKPGFEGQNFVLHDFDLAVSPLNFESLIFKLHVQLDIVLEGLGLL